MVLKRGFKQSIYNYMDVASDFHILFHKVVSFFWSVAKDLAKPIWFSFSVHLLLGTRFYAVSFFKHKRALYVFKLFFAVSYPFEYPQKLGPQPLVL